MMNDNKYYYKQNGIIIGHGNALMSGNVENIEIQENLTEEYKAFLNKVNKENLRHQREDECFSIINRGKLWYDNLTESQRYDLMVWYRAWLDVTDTNFIPQKPYWLN